MESAEGACSWAFLPPDDKSVVAPYCKSVVRRSIPLRWPAISALDLKQPTPDAPAWRAISPPTNFMTLNRQPLTLILAAALFPMTSPAQDCTAPATDPSTHSPVKFPAQGALPTKYPEDVMCEAFPAEKD
jgi:hypothetical protein